MLDQGQGSSIKSASNRDRIEPQINEGHKDNADEDEDDLRESEHITIKWQGLKMLTAKWKNQNCAAPIGVQEKLKKKKGSRRKEPIDGLSASDDPSQRCNAKIQTQNASVVPKNQGNALMKQEKTLIGILQPWEISVEISFLNRVEERADDDGSSGGEIKTRREQNNDIILRDNTREKSLTRDTERRIGRRNSDAYLIGLSEMVELCIPAKETQRYIEKDFRCDKVEQ
ncbi:MAG: hypothetical protein EZS28_012891 [Streblomastix strix]|uniref:Uncharacterized protein n=1 Tax=Streblomastix strix TaxID=222440 RepID=A0A5J4W9N2_9EUKA|nr:MAG: hypothetical protein EZS28_012891 [Streblomastix strix]